MDINIRAARQTDISGMMALMDQLYTRDINATLPSILAEYIRSSATCLVQVAETQEADPQIIGAVIGSYRLDLAMEARCGFVDAVVVDENYRSQGVGKMLMQSFAAWALSKQCTLLQLFSARGEWFEDLGFEVRDVNLHQMHAGQLAQ
jgi:N-acetylglutamate synthase-like GNAT family acetyltransferase